MVSEIKEAGGEALGNICNVCLQEYVDDMFYATMDVFGQVDVLVNNAGIMDNFNPIADTNDELWDKVLRVNLRGPFLTTRTAVRYFEKSERPGVIINNASVGGLFGVRGGVAYTASKHGLIGITKNTAAVYSDKGDSLKKARLLYGIFAVIRVTRALP